MAEIVAVAGAFRGAWYWEPLAEQLAPAGHRLRGVELAGTGDRADPRPDAVSLEDWIQDVLADVESNGLDRVVLMGHSMGGVVAQAAAGVLGPRVDRLVLLDSPLIRVGQRAVDVSGPTPPQDDQLPDRSLWIGPTPVGAQQGFDDPALAEWVNERLCAVPMGPQLDPVTAVGDQATTLVFFDRTRDGFPSTFARRRCDDDGRSYVALDEHHDAPVLAPAAVGSVLVELLRAAASGQR